MTTQIPDRDELLRTAERIAPYIHRTPVLTSQMVDDRAGASLFFKCENFQKIGAFKIRGATNAALQLTAEQQQRGLATHSSGNHAQAVALTAQNLGVPAYIVMPSTAPAIKQRAVKGYGAEVILCEPTLQARESTLEEVVARTGATFVHPYDDYRVIAGQSTAAQELLADVDDLDLLIAPVGGGGLLAGTALAAHHLAPPVKVYAAEPTGADDAYRSFQAKELIPSVNPNTIADGLLTSVGTRNFPIILEHVQDVLTVSDDEILDALRMVYERMKIVIEPSCATPLAAVFKHPEVFAGKRVGVILTGGNVDLNKLRW